jgi:hypothetical protein
MNLNLVWTLGDVRSSEPMTREASTRGAGAPLVLALDDPAAVPAVAGGKGASLGGWRGPGSGRVPRDDGRRPRFR